MEKFKLRARRREIESSLITTVDVPCIKVSNPLSERNKERIFLPSRQMEARRLASRVSLALARKEEKEFYMHASASIPTIKVPVIGMAMDRYSRSAPTKVEHFFELGYIKDTTTKKFFGLKYKHHFQRRQFNPRGFSKLLTPPTIGNLAFWYLADSADGSSSREVCGPFKIPGNSLIDIIRTFNLIPNTDLGAQDNLIIVPPPTPDAQEEIFTILDVDRIKASLPAGLPPHPILTTKGAVNNYRQETYSVNFTFNDTFLPLLNIWLKTHAVKCKTTRDDFYNNFTSFWTKHTAE